MLAGCQQILGIEEGSERASGGAAAAGAGGVAGGEVCNNASDDDGDELIDCEDSDCAASTCLAVPAGWTGPIVMALGSRPGASCTGDWAEEVFTGGLDLEADPATCTCGCGPITGLACGGSNVELYNGSNCTGGIVSTPIGSGAYGACVDVSGSTNSFKGAAPPATSGSCPGQLMAMETPPPTYSAYALGCGAKLGAGCDGACAPPLPAGYDYCVYTDASAVCPTEYPIPTDVVLRDNIDDTRGCTGCPNCTRDPSAICQADTEVFALPNCVTSIGSAAAEQCTNTATTPAQTARVMLTGNITPACAPGTSNSTGGVTAPTRTVCCASPP